MSRGHRPSGTTEPLPLFVPHHRPTPTDAELVDQLRRKVGQLEWDLRQRDATIAQLRDGLKQVKRANRKAKKHRVAHQVMQPGEWVGAATMPPVRPEHRWIPPWEDVPDE